MHVRIIAVGLSLCLTSIGYTADWNRFRGPNGSGVAADQSAVPSQWSPNENLRWKLKLPGPGVSCPIVIGDKVLVTSYSGYGESRENIGNMEDLQRHLLCIDKATGEVLWEKAIPSTATEDQYTGAGVPQHGYASHTPVSDGQRVYVFCGKSGVVAFDLQGNQLWQTSVGTDSDPMRWGSSSSPILVDDLLVVPAGAEARAVIGLDKNTGQEKWRADADGLGMVWGTPAVVSTDGSSEIVLAAPYEVWALNPENGKLRWYCETSEDEQFSASAVVQDNTVFVLGSRSGGSVAVKAGGKDDVAASHVVWKGRHSSRFTTPIVYDGKLFSVSDGIVTCLNAATGEEMYRSRLNQSDAEPAPPSGERGGRGGRGGGFGGGDYASPVIADGKLYHQSRGGEMYVLEAGNEFKQFAVNRVTNDSEDFSATPAVSDGALYIRSNKYLYCVSAAK